MAEINNMCVLGDSVLLGVTFDDLRSRYSMLREGALTAFTRNLGIKVHNLSRMGQTSPEAAQRLRQEFDSGYRPDAVLIELGGNDCNMPWDEIASDSCSNHQPAVSIGAFRGTIRGIIRTAVKYNAKPIVCTLPPLASLKFLEWVSKDAASRRSILSYLGDAEWIYRWHESYSLEAAMVAAEEGASIADLRGAFLRTRGYHSLICKDGMHPNSKGHLIIKESLLSHFEDAAFSQEGVLTAIA